MLPVETEKLTEQEKQRVKKLLNELNEIGPDELPDWNIRASTFLVFIVAKNPEAFFEANR